MRSMLVRFPEVVLPSGETRTVKALLHNAMRPQKLVLIGIMDEIRGHFWIKRSRLPRLNRESVIAYSNVTRVPSRRRTTIEHRDRADNSFVRSYLPSSVVYEHVDPLSYVSLTQLTCDKAPQMPANPGGVSATLFTSSTLGNGLALSRVRKRIELVFDNHGDIEVRVFSSIFGYGS